MSNLTTRPQGCETSNDYKFRNALWPAVKHITERSHITSLATERARFKIICTAYRRFHSLSGEARKRYAAFMFISRPELEEWVRLAHARLMVWEDTTREEFYLKRHLGFQDTKKESDRKEHRNDKLHSLPRGTRGTVGLRTGR